MLNYECLAVWDNWLHIQMHGGGAKKGGSGTDKVVNNEPAKRGGAIGGQKGGKASGKQRNGTTFSTNICCIM